MGDLKNRLGASENYGSWCAHRYHRRSSDSDIIKYKKIIHSDSNMDRNALNMGTGKNGILVDKISCFCLSGAFTAPRAGVYLITFSYYSSNDRNKETWIYIYKNGVRLKETGTQTGHTDHVTVSVSGTKYGSKVGSTGGRTVYQRLEAGHNITLQTRKVTGIMWNIIMCVEYIHK